MKNSVHVNRGADKRMRFQWADAEGGVVALANPRAFDVSIDIQERLGVVPVDLASGIFEVVFEGSDPIAVGSYFFRVQAENADGDSVSSERITINVI